MPALNVDKSKLLENFKKTITLVRGKKYTFKVNGIEEDGSIHPFYITTSLTGGSGFPGVVTENVEHSYERNVYPNLDNQDDKVTTANGFVYNPGLDR